MAVVVRLTVWFKGDTSKKSCMGTVKCELIIIVYDVYGNCKM